MKGPTPVEPIDSEDVKPTEHNSNSEELVDQLRQSLGLLQVAFDASDQPMLILDSANKVRWGNQAAADNLCNGLAIMLPGRAFADLVKFSLPSGQPIEQNHPSHPLSQMKLDDGEDRYLIHFESKNKEPVNAYRVQWRRVTEVPGGFELVTFANLSTTERSLLQYQRLIDQLAHELRTPLAIVNGCLKRLKRVSGLDSQELEKIDLAKQETRRIDRLLEQLSVLSQLDVGSYQIKFETRPLIYFVKQWSTKLDSKKRDRLSFNEDDGNFAVELRLDQQAFARVLNHLIDNSLRYSPAKSPIVITAKTIDDQLKIRFMDWGPGIPAEEQETVFDRFRRLEIFRTASHVDGCGLGLALVRELIEAMNGTARILDNRTSDEDLPQGAVVEMLLPVHRSTTAMKGLPSDNATHNENPPQEKRPC